MTTETAPERTTGLSSAEVRDREARGAVNLVLETTTRTVGEIIRANVITRFNLLITALLVVILFFAPVQDALFGIVMILNSAIGVYQEVKAKRTLDRLTLLTAPRVRVIRDGSARSLAVSAVVEDDLIELSAGDQLVVDCLVTESNGLEVDESLVTGESDPVAKEPGDRCLSGTFVVAGGGRCVAEAVGPAAFAARLAQQARIYTPVRSELRDGIDWLLGLISWLIPPTIALLVWSQMRAEQSLDQAVAGAVAGTVAAVPQGLVLLTSLAFALGVIRLGRRHVLVRELAAVEGLARVDTVCFDKTGTLTKARLSVQALEPLAPEPPAPLDEILGALAAADPNPNATLQALGAGRRPPTDWVCTATVPFSSGRKWSGATFSGRGSFVLGAPEILAADGDIVRRTEAGASSGMRVLLLASTPAAITGAAPPGDIVPLALVSVGDEARPEASATLRFLESQGVDTKVISGDHPRTVAAVAAAVGMTGISPAVDGRELPDDPGRLGEAVETGRVFGRVTPHQKRDMIAALRRRGHVVAMIGDGVNDALALKEADLGVAMGSGSPSSRAVAEVVLLDGDFGTLPQILDEGRRVAANIERVANLFLTKTVYAFFLAVAVAVFPIAFPFLPRHLTLVSSLTIGIPGFLLALEPTAPRARSGFLERVLRFAIPTGLVAAAATFLAYMLAQEEGVSLEAGRTVATAVLGAVGGIAVAMVARPLNRRRQWIVVGVGAGFAVTFLLPLTRRFFALELPRPVVALAAVGVISVTATLLGLGLKLSGWITHLARPRSRD